jgi:hypothetical protein
MASSNVAVATESAGDSHPTLAARLRSKPRFTSDEASIYLVVGHGITLATRTLDKLRSVGGGPPFVKFNGRALYERGDLDAWVLARLSKAKDLT